MRILGLRWRRLFGFRWRRAVGLLFVVAAVMVVAGASWRWMPAIAPASDPRGGQDVRDSRAALSMLLAREQASDIVRAVRVYGHERHALPDSLARLSERSDILDDAFLPHATTDPWGIPFRLRATGGGLRGFEVRSAGPDGRFETDDDVVASPR